MATYRFFSVKTCSNWKCYIKQVPRWKRKVKLIARITLATCFQILSTTAIPCCPPDSSSSKTARQHAHSAQRTELAAGQLSRFSRKWPVASKFAGSKPLDCHVWGAMLEAYHNLKTKPKTIAELKSALQVIWDNLPQEPIDKAVRLLKATEGLCCLWTLRTFTVTMEFWHLIIS